MNNSVLSYFDRPVVVVRHFFAYAGMLAFAFWVPFRSGAASGKYPQGRRVRYPSLFAATRMLRRKVSLAKRTLCTLCKGREGRVCFLLVTFICTSKEK